MTDNQSDMALVVYQGPTTNISNDSVGDQSDDTTEEAKATKVTRFSSAPMQYRSNNGHHNSSTIDRSADFVGLVKIYSIVIVAFSFIYTLVPTYL